MDATEGISRDIKEYFDTVLENIPAGVAILEGQEFRYAHINQYLADVNGLSIAEHLGKPLVQVLPDAAPDILPRLHNVMKTGEPTLNYEFSMRLPENPDQPRHFIDSFFPIKRVNGKPMAVGVVVLEITERKQAEEKLKLFRDLISLTNDAIFVVDPDTSRFLDVNETACSSLKYTREELLQMSVIDIEAVLPDHFSWKEHIRKVRAQGSTLIEGQHKCKDGAIFPVEVNVSFISHEQTNYMVAIVRDITERKLAEVELKRSEEQLKVLLKEKELLLNEVHHRVKNNLQLISSLLNLQAASIKNPQVQEYFQDSQDRVNAMALIHQRFFESKDFARVGFAEYIRSLTAHLVRSFGLNAQAVTVKVSADVVPLDVDQAVHCGLIINELVSNAFKHAFPAGRLGKIEVDVHEDRNGKVVLRVSDDGIGLPAGMEIKDAQTLGLTIVASLTEQLRGTIKINGQGGTAVTIAFPLALGKEQRVHP